MLLVQAVHGGRLEIAVVQALQPALLREELLILGIEVALNIPLEFGQRAAVFVSGVACP